MTPGIVLRFPDNEKRRPKSGAALDIQLYVYKLKRHNILGLQALGAALDRKLHALAFV